MIIAVVISIIVMMVYASKISNIIERYPSLEILAISFLILIGFNLIVEASHYSITKGYIYFALFFTLGVEYINIIFRKCIFISNYFPKFIISHLIIYQFLF